MSRYEIISFDMFQTLVDVNQRIPQIWQGILKEGYDETKAKLGAQAIFQCLPGIYKEAAEGKFETMEEVYVRCAKEVVLKTGFHVEASEIAYNLMLQHGYAPFYEEVLPVLQRLRSRCKIILSSDSNHLMVDPILKKIEFDQVFISDDLKCYKGDRQGRFFAKVLAELGIDGNKIIHIGDSAADIKGAHCAGIDTCWINRDHRSLGHEIKPDYIVSDLMELEKKL